MITDDYTLGLSGKLNSTHPGVLSDVVDGESLGWVCVQNRFYKVSPFVRNELGNGVVAI